MEVFYTTASPYARCVRALCVALGIYDQVRWTHCHPFDNEPRFLSVSPLGKVPCLLVDDEAIFDSDVIVDYFDQRFASGNMLAPVREDWGLSTTYSLLKGVMDAAVARRIEKTRAEEGKQSEFWWQRNTLALKRGLGDLQTRLGALAEPFCQLHIHYYCALDYLSFRHPDLCWQDEYPELAKSFKLLSKHNAFVQTAYIG